MAFDDEKTEKRTFGEYLKKSLKLYLRVVLGLAGVIVCAVGVVEVVSRLSANNQTLGLVEEPRDPPHLLQIFVDEEILTEDLGTTKRTVEMKAGKVYMTGNRHFAVNRLGRARNKVNGMELYAYYNNAYWNARRKFYIDHTINGGTEYVSLVANCENADIYAVNSMPIKLTASAQDNERLKFRVNPRHDIETLRKSDEILTERRLKGQKAAVWDGLEYNEYYMEFLRETVDIDTEMYGNFERYVTVGAVKFSAYEDSEPHRLIAEAVIEIRCYFPWEAHNVINMDEEETVNTALNELGLVTPNNYGYTTVELVEYWQREE